MTKELADVREQFEVSIQRLEIQLSSTTRDLEISRANERRLDAEVAERRRAERQAAESMARAAQRVGTLRQSGAIRVGARLSAVRERARGRRSRGIDGVMKVVLGQIHDARAALEQGGDAGRTLELGQGSDQPPPTEELRANRRAARARGDRTKVAVLAWDVGHNPFGRAHLLADLLRDRFDVELWGAQFERYGSDVWLPIRDTDIPVRRYPGAEFPEFFETMRGRRRVASTLTPSTSRSRAFPVSASASWRRSCGTVR